jgi:CRISPR type I-E-associated protein CasB/Cse2
MDLTMSARTRAELRRLDPWEVRGAYQWVNSIKSLPEFAAVEEARLMSVAPLVAEVREDSGKSLGVALRGVSEGRVRRLLASDREDIQDQLAKAVRLVKRSVSIPDLVSTVIYWGDHRRRQLARDYFGQEGNDEQQ